MTYLKVLIDDMYDQINRAIHAPLNQTSIIKVLNEVNTSLEQVTNRLDLLEARLNSLTTLNTDAVSTLSLKQKL